MQNYVLKSETRLRMNSEAFQGKASMEYADIALAARQVKSAKELCEVNERAEELFAQGNLNMTNQDWRDFTKLLGEIQSKFSAT